MCGGKGSRFSSGGAHKSMTGVRGFPVLGYVINYWRAFTDDFIFVVKNGKEPLIEFVNDLPIKAQFVEPDVLRGIAHGLTYVEPLIDAPFITVLGDCFCSGSFDFPVNLDYGIGVLGHARPEQIHRNYAVFTEGDRVIAVEEKPDQIKNDLCGMGFYFFQPDVFDYVRKTAPSKRTNNHEITDVLQTMVECGVDLRAVMFNGTYVNINTQDDLVTVDAALTAASTR
jgi:dTDP-glucose pyrophosphorylase